MQGDILLVSKRLYKILNTETKLQNHFSILKPLLQISCNVIMAAL